MYIKQSELFTGTSMDFVKKFMDISKTSSHTKGEILFRENDPAIEPLVAALEHPQTRTVVKGERAFLTRLEGGCQVPMAAHGSVANNVFTINGLVASLDGKTVIKDTLSGPADSSEAIGLDLAERLIAMGAQKILESLIEEIR